MVDCKWAGTASDSPAVPLGRKYELASGLMEITYDTGAKVILQGPVTYEVESANGGFLSVGKLTAKLEKKAEGGGRKVEEKSEIQISNRNSPPPVCRPDSHRHRDRPGHGVWRGSECGGAYYLTRLPRIGAIASPDSHGGAGGRG